MQQSKYISQQHGPRNIPLSLEGYFQRATGVDSYYVAGACNGIALTTASVVVNVLYAQPLAIANGGWIDRLVFRVITGGAGGSVSRCGIYKARSSHDLYPGDLIVDSGEKATTASTTTHTTTVNVYLEPGVLYWAAFLCGTAAPTVRGLTVNTAHPIFGIDANIGTAFQQGIKPAQAYGALPSTFTQDYTAIITAAPIPAIAVRLATGPS